MLEMDLATPEGADEQPTLALPTGEQCGSCGAQLARDQRYCVECGDRRGKPRLPFMDGRPRQAPAPAAAAPPPSRRRRAGGSAGATLVAGVGTLVLALGVGVLIGRSGDNGGGHAAAPAVQVVTVAGGGGGAAADTDRDDRHHRGERSPAEDGGRSRTRSSRDPKLPPPTVRARSERLRAGLQDTADSPASSSGPEEDAMRAMPTKLLDAVRGRRDTPSVTRRRRRRRRGRPTRRRRTTTGSSTSSGAATSSSPRVAELQWDLGGLVYEMAIRNHIQVDVLVQRAAVLQEADAELSEVERILRTEETGDRRRLRLLRRAAQQRRDLLLAVRPAAARAGLQRAPSPLGA